MIFMNEVYHYTSKENWRRIQEDGVLHPFTNPFFGGMKRVGQKSKKVDMPSIFDTGKSCSEVSRIMIESEGFLVGLPSPTHEGWNEYGLMDALLRHTSGEVILRIPVINPKGAFIRDHARYSPRRFMELYGINLFDICGSSEKCEASLMEILIREETWNERRTKAWADYLQSQVSFKEYKGDYLAPEIWLSQYTSVNLIEEVKSQAALVA